MGAIVMDGAVIEPGGMLAAGAMLTPGQAHSQQASYGQVGPPKKMRDLSLRKKSIFNQNSAKHYVEVARAHRLGHGWRPFRRPHANTPPATA
jgi:carbonic anhydrase/acetyltransferase-like protein (isoleucine patch superfamily)